MGPGKIENHPSPSKQTLPPNPHSFKTLILLIQSSPQVNSNIQFSPNSFPNSQFLNSRGFFAGFEAIALQIDLLSLAPHVAKRTASPLRFRVRADPLKHSVRRSRSAVQAVLLLRPARRFPGNEVECEGVGQRGAADFDPEVLFGCVEFVGVRSEFAVEES